MKRITKLSLTTVLVALALGVLIFYFWPRTRNGAPNVREATKTKLLSNDPYNITAVKSDENIHLDIVATKMTLAGLDLTRYLYTDPSKSAYSAGLPLVIDEGKPVTITVNNQSGTTTNVHWHGLTVPNSQDGPDLAIKSGSSHVYQFTPTEAGTYWAHSHYRPVETQVGDGMYAPLIVRGKNDAKYSLDEIVMLSDLTDGGGGGMMSGQSVTDLVNGKTVMNTLTVKSGTSAQLRFINASADNTKTIDFPFPVIVTHRDGYALAKEMQVSSLTLYPGQRADIEFANANDNQSGQTYAISDSNAKIPVKMDYQPGVAYSLVDPFRPAKASPVNSSLLGKKPDFIITLAAGSGTGMMTSSGMTWSMNGKVYPDTGTLAVKVGQTYKVEFVNSDQGMMAIDHPIHIHGAHFQVLSVNGQPTTDDTWYDTYPMKVGTATDIAVKFDQPGVWMVHCHILAHEDGGMMMSFTAK